MRWIFIASLVWAGYAAGLARIIGEGFADDHTKAFWIAFGTALAINVLIEVVRHRLTRTTAAGPLPAPALAKTDA